MSHTFESEKTAARTSAVAPNVLPCKRNEPFLLGYHPSSWTFEKGEYVPRLKRFYFEPGVNGVKLAANGRGDPTLMIAAMQARGWVFLTDEEPVLYQKGGETVRERGYLKRYRARGGWVYCTVWDHPSVLGAGREAKVQWGQGFQRDAYWHWRRELCERHGWKPSPGIISRLVRSAQKRAGRRVAEAHDGAPHIQAHVEAQLKAAKAMQEAGDRVHTPVPFDIEPERATLAAEGVTVG